MTFNFSMLKPPMPSVLPSSVMSLSQHLGRRVGVCALPPRAALLTLALVCVCGAASAQGVANEPAAKKPAAAEAPPPTATQTAAPTTDAVTPKTTVEAPAVPSAQASTDAAAAAKGPSAAAAATPASAPPSVPAATAAESSSSPAVATVTPSSPAPTEPEAPLNALFDVAIVVQNSWNTSPAYDYFSDDDVLLMAGLSLGLDVASITADTVVALDVSAITGETDNVGPLPQYITNSTLRRTDVGAGLVLRHHVWFWLAPYVRLSGAAAFEKATVTSVDFNPLTVEDTHFAGTFGGGFTLFSPAKRVSSTRSYFNSLAFRLSVEGGYQLLGAIPFEVPASTTESGITRAAIPVGELEQSGAYLRLTAGARF